MIQISATQTSRCMVMLYCLNLGTFRCPHTAHFNYFSICESVIHFLLTQNQLFRVQAIVTTWCAIKKQINANFYDFFYLLSKLIIFLESTTL